MSATTDSPLSTFGFECLRELSAGEFEPDWDWQQKMLERAKALGILVERAVTEDDDVSFFECDFIYELAGEAAEREKK